MGEEISKSQFSDEEFVAFERKLKEETDLLERWFQTQKFYHGPHEGGSELEGWLIDKNGVPAPRNVEFLASHDDEQVVPELSLFNIEFNTDPEALTSDALERMENSLYKSWERAARHAEGMDLDLIMIGILPTVREQDLTIEHMSNWQRYKALNEGIFRMREGKPIKLEIEGREKLSTTHFDVMLEAAATSFQVHLKINQHTAVRYFNAAKLVSAPVVAVSANSPYLFGRDLWAETRIPLFEQAISVDEWDYAERVTFGVRYLDRCLSETFVANRQRYEALLPMVTNDPIEKMSHLRLHNGTIWRWNRALLGNEADGSPHLRIEHRIIPSGPTIHDAIANAAFYFGLVEILAHRDTPLEEDIPFRYSRNNFYACAKDGLEAQVLWKDRQRVGVRDLILEDLAPMAREGLARLEIKSESIDRYMGTIEARARTGANGSAWQRSYVGTHGKDMAALTQAYLERQKTGQPVHEWDIP
jgi:glutamate-cysteine ligase